MTSLISQPELLVSALELFNIIHICVQLFKCIWWHMPLCVVLSGQRMHTDMSCEDYDVIVQCKIFLANY